jgi:hypothetical protein
LPTQIQEKEEQTHLSGSSRSHQHQHGSNISGSISESVGGCGGRPDQAGKNRKVRESYKNALEPNLTPLFASAFVSTWSNPADIVEMTFREGPAEQREGRTISRARFG